MDIKPQYIRNHVEKTEINEENIIFEVVKVGSETETDAAAYEEDIRNEVSQNAEEAGLEERPVHTEYCQNRPYTCKKCGRGYRILTTQLLVTATTKKQKDTFVSNAIETTCINVI
ncbi:unnamed protein product [Acanthoscelides obtectus]|uniref:Uncharacterized protein n=1 Tax=Acanthoscelides obtectus TaxID=200917 RepID=A0A9P0NYJ6_ACAOB|nr:unnamed protein product [Acanthoscelides obtectus]CAK1669651.1 hypothetical protein AOBTE_LOCUS27132 [Acanthoscelides obtectus]